MINYPKQIALLYEDAMQDFGEAIAYQLFSDTRIVLNDLRIGFMPTATATYLGCAVDINVRFVFGHDTKVLTNLVLECKRVKTLQEGITVTVDSNNNKLFDCVRLGRRLLEFLEVDDIKSTT